MSSSSSCSHLSSSFKEEVMFRKKQGIVSILGSADAGLKPNNQSLKRTLSADMSSTKWLSQNGFSISSRLKRIASSEEFPVIVDSSSFSASSSAEIWNSIQQEKQKESAPGQFDIWNSILTQKAQEEAKNPLPPPYIHPLIKRSSSSLSKKSLEICTESLGSETGSDGFSSYPPSEIGDAEEDKNEGEEEEKEKKEKERPANDYDMEDWEVAKNNTFSTTKKVSPRAFPPLPSLSSRDGASLRMKSHRDNGRLVLEAISFPSQNNFKSDRQDGRLVLSFINSPDEQGGEAMKDNWFQVEVENSAEEEEMNEERGGRKERYIMEQPPNLSNDFINVHKLAFIMNKPIVLANKNPAWSNKFNEMIKFGEGMEQKVNPMAPVARIIPVAPAVGSAASSLNAYESYWKCRPMGTAGVTAYLSPITNKSNNNYTVTKNERRKEIIVSGNKGDRFVFKLQKECKEPRRSLFSLESRCIATS